jgi:hypothetical protein
MQDTDITNKGKRDKYRTSLPFRLSTRWRHFTLRPFYEDPLDRRLAGPPRVSLDEVTKRQILLLTRIILGRSSLEPAVFFCISVLVLYKWNTCITLISQVMQTLFQFSLLLHVACGRMFMHENRRNILLKFLTKIIMWYNLNSMHPVVCGI